MKRVQALLLVFVGAAASTAAVAGPPVFHAGEWRTRIGEGQINLVCEHADHVADQASLQRLLTVSDHGGKCEAGDFHSLGPVTSFSMTCEVAGGRMTTHDTITWRGPDAYSSHLQSHFEGGSMAIPDMDMTQEAQRVGPCQPGDRQSPF